MYALPPTQFSVMSVFEVFFYFFSSHITAHLSCMQRCHRTVFLLICIHSPSHYGLPHPVLLCPQSVSLSLMSSLLPSPLSLLQHSSDLCLPCWTRSDTGRRQRKRRTEECQTVSCFYCQNIALAFFVFLHLLFRIPGSLVKDGRAWSQTQR